MVSLSGDRLGRLTFITLQTVQENKDKHFVYNSNIGIHLKINKTKCLKISYRINKFHIRKENCDANEY
ncbi:unnamed protein product [Schistosoma mattheei]|uniref:Uncharacterized protein n=1 Tax=Schistosoma mattheei TaxID=31246 RepID=A0AA85BCL5_9TREM|nr:unnamed protein product [Schistosoma mattheei]